MSTWRYPLGPGAMTVTDKEIEDRLYTRNDSLIAVALGISVERVAKIRANYIGNKGVDRRLYRRRPVAGESECGTPHLSVAEQIKRDSAYLLKQIEAVFDDHVERTGRSFHEVRTLLANGVMP